MNTTELLKEVDDTLGEIEFYLEHVVEFKHEWHLLRDKVRRELAVQGRLPDPVAEDWEKQKAEGDDEQIAKALKHIEKARAAIDPIYCPAIRRNSEEHLRRAVCALKEE
jgi:hypothetical protein